MPGAALGIVVLGVHGGGSHGGPGLPVVSDASVQFIANRQCVIEVQRQQRGRDMAGEAFDDDADPVRAQVSVRIRDVLAVLEREVEEHPALTVSRARWA